MNEATLSFDRDFNIDIFKKSCDELDASIVNVEVSNSQDTTEYMVSVTVRVRDVDHIFLLGRTYENHVRFNDRNLSRYEQKVEVEIPMQLLKLCDLLDTLPSRVIQSFIDDLSLQVHGSNGSDERMMAVDYFLRCGYGTHIFDCDQVEEIFDDLDTIRRNWKDYGNDKENEYTTYFHSALDKWFQNWDEIKQEQEA